MSHLSAMRLEGRFLRKRSSTELVSSYGRHVCWSTSDQVLTFIIASLPPATYLFTLGVSETPSCFTIGVEMGHQESSSSPPHHHHHRHHHNHNHSRRYSHRSAARTANRHSAWSLERLNRESYAPNRDAVVESWLGQVAAPVPLTQLVSPESRNHLVHRGKRPRPKERHISPCRQHAEGVDPLWRSQRIPPSQGSSPPCPPLLMGNSRRYTRSSGDSSLIGGLSPRRELGDGACMKTISEHEESSHYKPQEEAEVEIPGARSPTFYATAAPVFEKRLRHKTRADKYDAKKLGSRKKRKKPPDQERHPPRKSKSRRKHLVTGKHVMNNFTSEAVLGDRITVRALG